MQTYIVLGTSFFLSSWLGELLIVHVFILRSFTFKQLSVLENILIVQILKTRTWSGLVNGPCCLCAWRCLSLHWTPLGSASGAWDLGAGETGVRVAAPPACPRLLKPGVCFLKPWLVLICHCHRLKQVFQVNAGVVWLWRVGRFVMRGWCLVWLGFLSGGVVVAVPQSSHTCPPCRWHWHQLGCFRDTALSPGFCRERMAFLYELWSGRDLERP